MDLTMLELGWHKVVASHVKRWHVHIFTHLKLLWVALAKRNFKWVEIYIK